MSFGTMAVSTNAEEQPKVIFNGRELKLTLPIINMHDINFYPFRELVEEIGGVVDWAPEIQSAIAMFYSNGGVIAFRDNDDKYIYNYVEYTMPVNSFTDNGRMYVPIRYVVQHMGYNANDRS